MKIPIAFVVWMSLALGVTARIGAQSVGASPIRDAELLSIYAERDAAVLELAEVGAASATLPEVRKLAEAIAGQRRKAAEKVRKIAAERELTLSPQTADSTRMAVKEARRDLRKLSGHAFDSTWVTRAVHTVTVDLFTNMTVISPRVTDRELKATVRDYSSRARDDRSQLMELLRATK